MLPTVPHNTGCRYESENDNKITIFRHTKISSEIYYMVDDIIMLK